MYTANLSPLAIFSHIFRASSMAIRLEHLTLRFFSFVHMWEELRKYCDSMYMKCFARRMWWMFDNSMLLSTSRPFF